MLKLNAGCAVVYENGYTNIDLHCLEADLKADVREPLPYKDNSVDEILASHLLEHFKFRELPKVLQNFHRVLKQNGVLHIRVPDLLKVLQNFIDNKDGKRWSWTIKEIYGGQWNDGECHHNGFTEDRLIDILKHFGFEVKEILEPRKQNETENITEINIVFKKT